ncbi:MAG: site-2 protease family protein [Oscillospiraceae bacterium]
MITFSLNKIKISVSFSFFATIALLVLLKEQKYTLFGIYACIIHEFGHAFVMRILGINIGNVIFYGAGIKIVYKSDRILPLWKDIIVLFAGSATNLLLAFAMLIFSAGKENFLIFAGTNIVLGIFNLLPINCFDGGRIAELLIERYFLEKNMIFAKNFLKIFSYSIIGILAVLFLIGGNYNFTFYVTIIYFIISSVFL